MNAAERLHGQIFGRAVVPDDSDDPAVDLALVLAKESLKGFEIARRESLQQLHAPLFVLRYCK